MGWTEIYTGKKNMTAAQRKDEITREFTEENATRKWYFEKLSMDGVKAHGVYCVEDKNTGEVKRQALTVLTYVRNGHFGYKDINPIFMEDYPLTMFNQIKDNLGKEDAEKWGEKIAERVERDRFFRNCQVGDTVKIVCDFDDEGNPVHETYTLRIGRVRGSKNLRKLWVNSKNVYLPTSDVKKIAVI